MHKPSPSLLILVGGLLSWMFLVLDRRRASAVEPLCLGGFLAPLAPNAGAHLLPEAGATQERSNCLGCQGGLVYFFSFAPPEVARASDASAWH